MTGPFALAARSAPLRPPLQLHALLLGALLYAPALSHLPISSCASASTFLGCLPLSSSAMCLTLAWFSTPILNNTCSTEGQTLQLRATTPPCLFAFLHPDAPDPKTGIWFVSALVSISPFPKLTHGPPLVLV